MAQNDYVDLSGIDDLDDSSFGIDDDYEEGVAAEIYQDIEDDELPYGDDSSDNDEEVINIGEPTVSPDEPVGNSENTFLTYSQSVSKKYELLSHLLSVCNFDVELFVNKINLIHEIIKSGSIDPDLAFVYVSTLSSPSAISPDAIATFVENNNNFDFELFKRSATSYATQNHAFRSLLSQTHAGVLAHLTNSMINYDVAEKLSEWVIKKAVTWAQHSAFDFKDASMKPEEQDQFFITLAVNSFVPVILTSIPFVINKSTANDSLQSFICWLYQESNNAGYEDCGDHRRALTRVVKQELSYFNGIQDRLIREAIKSEFILAIREHWLKCVSEYVKGVKHELSGIQQSHWDIYLEDKHSDPMPLNKFKASISSTEFKQRIINKSLSSRLEEWSSVSHKTILSVWGAIEALAEKFEDNQGDECSDNDDI